jgi:hypothetical protein
MNRDIHLALLGPDDELFHQGPDRHHHPGHHPNRRDSHLLELGLQQLDPHRRGGPWRSPRHLGVAAGSTSHDVRAGLLRIISNQVPAATQGAMLMAVVLFTSLVTNRQEAPPGHHQGGREQRRASLLHRVGGDPRPIHGVRSELPDGLGAGGAENIRFLVVKLRQIPEFFSILPPFSPAFPTLFPMSTVPGTDGGGR